MRERERERKRERENISHEVSLERVQEIIKVIIGLLCNSDMNCLWSLNPKTNKSGFKPLDSCVIKSYCETKGLINKWYHLETKVLINKWYHRETKAVATISGISGIYIIPKKLLYTGRQTDPNQLFTLAKAGDK